MKKVNPEYLMTAAEGREWHEFKSTLGPIYPGYDSFIPYMNWVREKLEGFGCVDFLDHHWQMESYIVRDWPGHEEEVMGLKIDGRDMPVGTFCMLSASTGRDGVEAPMVFWDISKGMPPEGSMEGKIIVIDTPPHPEKPYESAYLESYVITDTNYRSDPQPDFEMFEKPDPQVNCSWNNRWNFFSWWDIIPLCPKMGGAEAMIICSDMTKGALRGLYDRQKARPLPTIVVDRVTKKEVLEAARAGKNAWVKLESEFFWTDAFNYFMFQPGRYYGTDKDEYITVNVHVDAMSLTQDNGSIGAIGIARYFSHIPQEERKKTIVYCIDSRHFIEGFENGNFRHDPYVVHPEVKEKTVVSVGLEHMGEMAARENYEKNTMEPTGMPEFSFMKTDDNDWCAQSLIRAAALSGLERADIKIDGRPGIHGARKGFVRAVQASTHRLGVCVMGEAGNWPGAHTQTYSTMQYFDEKKFRDEVHTWTQVVQDLMDADSIVYDICWHDLNTAIRKAEAEGKLTSLQKEGLLSEVSTIFGFVTEGEYRLAAERLDGSCREALSYCLKDSAGECIAALDICIDKLIKRY